MLEATHVLMIQAGVQVLSDIMRRELAPVGIDVITIELGTCSIAVFPRPLLALTPAALVKTAMSDGSKDFNLVFDTPDDGLYDASAAMKQAAAEFEESGKTAPLPKDIARDIINAVEKQKSPGKLWLGKQSYVFKHLLPYLPVSSADGLLSKIMRVDLVKK